ncbi:hypothetical protein ACIOJE_27365 [Kitasatospora sp. NPDC087861]|uniref:hypothetical protein n=1 Tax=Kitasatospora sp. NPDC087861 TaxID=3364070 RepID=UPI0037FA97BE
MLSFTLDTNCLIALEEGRPAASGVLALLDRHTRGSATVRLAATTAAESQRDGTAPPSFEIFQSRLRAVGLSCLSILKPVAIFDLVYFDWAEWPEESSDAELRRIHQVLFPSFAFEYDRAVPESLTEEQKDKAERKWRNYRLDGLGLHTHIRAGADVYVTSDRNFFKQAKKAQLAQLGAPVILPPDEAESYAASR